MGSLGDIRNGTIDLPIINISQATPEVGKQTLYAASKYGFLYIDTEGTGLTEELVTNEFEISKKLFALDVSEKEEYHIDQTNTGWSGMGNEILDPKHQRKADLKEAYNFAEFNEGRPKQPIPPAIKDDMSQHYQFEQRCVEVCKKVLDLLALGLELEDKKFFSARHTQPSGTTVRLLHYPHIPAGDDFDPELDIRAGAHSDYGSMTLLFQRPGQPGLEIRAPDNTWAPVEVIPEGYTTSKTLPPILINIGDLMSFWTNGLLKSTVHRVIFPKDSRHGGEDRYSIAVFCHPGHDTELVPVPSKLIQDLKLNEDEEVGYGGGATKKRAMTAKEHLRSRLDATYTDIKGKDSPVSTIAA